MDWAGLGGELIKKGFPTIGTALGGPLGGMVGGLVGDIIASKLGTSNDPDAINDALQNTPADVLASRLSAAEQEAIAKWPALAEIAKANAQQSESINATIRAELVSGQRWYAWRNLYGYSVVMEAGATTWVILYGLLFDAQIFKNILNSFNFFISWYTLRFGLLGLVNHGANNEKVAAVTGEAPSIIKNVAKAIRGK